MSELSIETLIEIAERAYREDARSDWFKWRSVVTAIIAAQAGEASPVAMAAPDPSMSMIRPPLHLPPWR